MNKSCVYKLHSLFFLNIAILVLYFVGIFVVIENSTGLKLASKVRRYSFSILLLKWCNRMYSNNQEIRSYNNLLSAIKTESIDLNSAVDVSLDETSSVQVLLEVLQRAERRRSVAKWPPL